MNKKEIKQFDKLSEYDKKEVMNIIRQKSEYNLAYVNSQLLVEIQKLKKENKIQKQIIDNALIIGDWECKDSPIGVCIYSIDDEDDCIYCGQPYERK